MVVHSSVLNPWFFPFFGTLALACGQLFDEELYPIMSDTGMLIFVITTLALMTEVDKDIIATHDVARFLVQVAQKGDLISVDTHFSLASSVQEQQQPHLEEERMSKIKIIVTGEKRGVESLDIIDRVDIETPDQVDVPLDHIDIESQEQVDMESPEQVDAESPDEQTPNGDGNASESLADASQDSEIANQSILNKKESVGVVSEKALEELAPGNSDGATDAAESTAAVSLVRIASKALCSVADDIDESEITNSQSATNSIDRTAMKVVDSTSALSLVRLASGGLCGNTGDIDETVMTSVLPDQVTKREAESNGVPVMIESMNAITQLDPKPAVEVAESTEDVPLVRQLSSQVLSGDDGHAVEIEITDVPSDPKPDGYIAAGVTKSNDRRLAKSFLGRTAFPV